MTHRVALEAHVGSRQTFTGEIAAIRKKFILLRNVRLDQQPVADHVWVVRGDCVPHYHFYPGDKICFAAEVYEYYRRNTVRDFGLRFVSRADIRLSK